jgi:hypothetical protein
MYKSNSYLFFALIIIILTTACHQKTNKTKLATNGCDSCCLKSLAIYADTLNLDTNTNFKYLDSTHFKLDNCQLKKYRGNQSLKNSLVLIWLKIDNIYKKHGWAYSYTQEIIGGQGKAANQIVHELYFLAVKQDQEWIESMEPSMANNLIKEDQSLLNNNQIDKFYNANKVLTLKWLKKRTHSL